MRKAARGAAVEAGATHGNASLGVHHDASAIIAGRPELSAVHNCRDGPASVAFRLNAAPSKIGATLRKENFRGLVPRRISDANCKSNDA
jgi:hypothetical protein